MTPEKQRIAIAEACGWRQSTMSKRSCFDPEGISTYWDNAPDYLNDLNAMHEAEELFFSSNWPHGWGKYADNIMRVMGTAGDYDTPYFHATAGQRAEAFLRTIGKWE